MDSRVDGGVQNKFQQTTDHFSILRQSLENQEQLKTAGKYKQSTDLFRLDFDYFFDEALIPFSVLLSYYHIFEI